MSNSRAFLNLRIAIYLRRLIRASPFREDQVADLQFTRLRELLIHSFNTFDFYKDLFTQAKFDPATFKSIDELQALPIVDKHMYKQFTSLLVKQQPDLYENYYRDETSGSSGIPLVIYRTWDERAYMLAKFLRCLFLNGYSIFDKTFSIPPPCRIEGKDSFLQLLGIMPRHCVPVTEPVEKYVSDYISYSPDVLYALKSCIVQMALYARDHGIDLKKPKLYISGGEVLDDSSRQLIQSVFGNDNLINVYGTAEFSTLAFQIPGQDYHYWCNDTNILELLENGTVNDTTGTTIVTDLHIRSFPMIRYNLGDKVDVSYRNGSKVITKLLGRDDDYVTLKDMSRRGFVSFEIAMEHAMEAIRQYRIVQETLDSIRLIIVPEEGADHEAIKRMLIPALHDEISRDVDYYFDFVSSIEPDPSGKVRMLVSNVE